LRAPDAGALADVELAAIRLGVRVHLGVSERPQQDLQAGAEPRGRAGSGVELGVERVGDVDVQDSRPAFLDAAEEGGAGKVLVLDRVRLAAPLRDQLALDVLLRPARLAGALARLLREVALRLGSAAGGVLRLLAGAELLGLLDGGDRRALLLLGALGR